MGGKPAPRLSPPLVPFIPRARSWCKRRPTAGLAYIYGRGHWQRGHSCLISRHTLSSYRIHTTSNKVDWNGVLFGVFFAVLMLSRGTSSPLAFDNRTEGKEDSILGGPPFVASSWLTHLPFLPRQPPTSHCVCSTSCWKMCRERDGADVSSKSKLFILCEGQLTPTPHATWDKVGSSDALRLVKSACFNYAFPLAGGQKFLVCKLYPAADSTHQDTKGLCNWHRSAPGARS